MATVDYFGYNYPFYDKTFVLPPQEGLRLIKNDLLQLLLTSPGERVRRPDYGTIIRASVFEPLDSALEANIRDSIREAIFLYEQRVDLKSIIIDRNEANYLMSITVYCSLRSDPNITVNVTANLNDETI